MGAESAMPTNIPQLIYILLLLACMVIGFLSTLVIKGLLTSVKELTITAALLSARISALETAHSIRHPGELLK